MGFVITRPVLAILAGLIIYLTAGQARGGEASWMRGLQDGPWGDGLSFARMHKTEVEAGYNGSRQTAVADADTIELVGLTDIHEVGFAAGYRVNRNLRFASFWETTMREQAYHTAEHSFDYSSQTAYHELGAGPVVSVDNLVFGGAVSALMMEEETRTVSLHDEQVYSELPATMIPRMRVYGGIYTKSVRFVLGLKSFNRSKVTRTITRQGAEEDYQDATRSLPGEVWLDARLRATPNVIFAFAITGEGLAQQNRPIDDEMVGFALTDADSGTQAAARYRNRVSLGFGGVYRASEQFRLSSSLKLRQASYRDSQYASAIADNLGGTEINVGSVSDLDSILFKFNAGYFVPNAVRYEVTDARATPWADVGSRVAVESPTWKLGLSASIPL